MKLSMDAVVRVLFLIVGVLELGVGLAGRYPNNLGSLAIGAVILCWLALRWRAAARSKTRAGGDDTER